MRLKRGLTDRSKKLLTGIVLTTALLTQAVPLPVKAADSLLEQRYDRMSDALAGSVATHVIGLTTSDTAQSVGSISFEFCTNDPIPLRPCTPPSGFDISGAVLDNQTGEVGFSIDTVNSTSNRLVLTRVPAVPTGVPSEYTLSNVVNPDVAGTFYIRLQTYGSTDATGIDVQNGGVALAIVSPFTVDAEVPEVLHFCVAVTIVSFDCSTATDFFIDLGFLNPNTPAVASSQFVVATNAILGYAVTVNGITMTSGNNTIPALNSPTASSPGTGQFGLNLRANTSPNVGSNSVGAGLVTPTAGYNTPNLFKFTNGEIIASVNHSDNFEKFTASYITNISANQPPGVYTTTITYICLANF